MKQLNFQNHDSPDTATSQSRCTWALALQAVKSHRSNFIKIQRGIIIDKKVLSSTWHLWCSSSCSRYLWNQRITRGTESLTSRQHYFRILFYKGQTSVRGCQNLINFAISLYWQWAWALWWRQLIMAFQSWWAISRTFKHLVNGIRIRYCSHYCILEIELSPCSTLIYRSERNRLNFIVSWTLGQN